MYNSPATPIACISNSASSTYTRVLAIGLPMGTFSSISSPISYPVANVVLSVGPYTFSRRHGCNASRALLPCRVDITSPPVSNCRIPCNPSNSPSTIALNSAVVRNPVVTPSSLINFPNASSDGRSSPTIAIRPPPHNGPHTSNVEASNAIGAQLSTTSPSSRAYQFPHTNRTMLPWLTPIPFGFPVDPDVYITYAKPSGHCSTPTSSPLSPPISSALSSSLITSAPHPFSFPPCRLLLTINLTPELSVMYRIRSCGYSTSSGT